MYLLESLTESFNINFIFKLFYNKYFIKYNYSKKIEQFIENIIFNDLGYNKNIFDIKNNKENISDKNDIISKLITAHRQNPSNNSTKNGILRELSAFFVAASDTIIHSTEYTLILLAKHDDLQIKIYNELYDIFGTDIFWDNIKLRDNIHKLHILRAFIHESLRIGGIAGFGLK